ncbi:hypothetical protein DFP94_11671 [Fontibacillus phaseoli]|uniref:Uncharacterized protein n=1 Tax=Fontibacillus phaseoli TaxID=1416533 RepID=A0A369AZR8_9BACL|nr:hypothetical protein DFP94_11671 [Fontibacillus phaseoli]
MHIYRKIYFHAKIPEKYCIFAVFMREYKLETSGYH